MPSSAHRIALKKFRQVLKDEIEQEEQFRITITEAIEEKRRQNSQGRIDDSAWETSIKTSKKKEKFNRLCYNLDCPKADRINKQITELDLETLAEFMEDSTSIGLIAVPDKGNIELHDNDEGTRQYADIIKEQSESRTKRLNLAFTFWIEFKNGGVCPQ